MAIFKRGGVYWYHFIFNGRHIQKSSRKTNQHEARQEEAAERTRLRDAFKERANKAEALGCKAEDLLRCPECEKLFNGAASVAAGELKFCSEPCSSLWRKKHTPTPTLREFSQRFIDAIQVRCEAKPKTVEFYAQQLSRLLEFDPLASARLDMIDEALIESFVQHRLRQRSRAGANRKRRREPIMGKSISPATVNRALATLRRLLRLAQEWRVIERVPRIRLLAGERNREFILSHAQERVYLENTPQPLKDIAMLILDTGLRIGEVLALEWTEIHLAPATGARFGYLHVRNGKSRFARRNVPLTGRVRGMLEKRDTESKGLWVFSETGGHPLRNSSLGHLHQTVRQTLKMPGGFVLHSLRHTYGTRLGEAGADTFTIMRLMGHSSITVSQRYVHPTPEALERAVERLEKLNAKARRAIAGTGKRQLPATFSATPKILDSVSH